MKKIYFLPILLFVCLSFFSFAQPANDALCSPTALTVNGGCSSGTNVASTNVHSTPTCWGSASNDVWFSFVATSAAMTISTDYAGGTLGDTQLALYSSSNNTCTGTLTQVGCNDDGGLSFPLRSIINATGLVVGNTYFVRLDGFGTATGTFCIGAYDTPSANELTGTACAYATPVYPNNLACSPANGNSAWNAHLSSNTPTVGTNYAGCDNETAQLGGWSMFTANATTTTITNTTAGANQNPMDYTVFTGTCSALTVVNCYSVAKGGSISFATTVGTTYYVLTTLQSGSTSAFRSDHCITSTAACTPPANDACAGATVISANTAYSVTNACATPDGTLCAGSNENNIWFSWTCPAGWSGPTYFQLYDQRCQQGLNSPGMQVSVYNANQSCNPSGCVVSGNPVNDEDITLGWNATPGQTYLITFDGYGGETCTMNFAITDVVTTILLPIELLSFDVFNTGKEIESKWITATESNNNYFTLEKSKDGASWEVVAVVASQALNGNSTQVLNYSKIDFNPYSGTSYYRLKQTDYDGKSSYSGVKAVEFGDDTDLDFNIVPNPANQDGFVLNFNQLSYANYTLQIVDLTGKLVYSKPVQITDTKLEINETLSKGMYFLQLKNADNSFTKKLIIK